MFDGWYDDFVVENNLIITNTYHGIAFYGARNCKIVNNTVVSLLDNISPVGTAPINVFPLKGRLDQEISYKIISLTESILLTVVFQEERQLITILLFHKH